LPCFEKLESRFECDRPGVNVVLVSSANATDDYYSDDESAHKGFQYVSADVYEIDTILLTEFIALGKIAPISLPYDDFAPEAIEAVSRGGKVYGVPHWRCGNFLFYRAGDVEIANARS
jgi:thiamine pyridinylase